MCSSRWIAAVLAGSCLLAAAPSVAAPAANDAAFLAAAKSGVAARLGPWLANLHDEYQSHTGKGPFTTKNPVLKLDRGGVWVEGFALDPPAVAAGLAALGAMDVLQAGPLFSARVPVSRLGQLAAMEGLGRVTASIARARAGTVTSQGDVSLRSDLVRAASSLDGGGLRIGVISDSVACNPPPFNAGQPRTTAAEDLASGDLPPDTAVFDNGPCPATDEGRGMMQLIRDVAPGAAQAFHTANRTMLDFALGILELGGVATSLSDVFGLYTPAAPEFASDIIVDDIIYFVEPMFSDGQVGQAADLVAGAGIPYFSAAGNQARLSYEAAFDGFDRLDNAGRSSNGGKARVVRRHDFNPGGGVDDLQRIRLTQFDGVAFIALSFQWDQPHRTATTFANLVEDGAAAQLGPGATTDLDVLFYNDKGILVPFCPPGVATGITCQLTGTNNLDGDAAELVALFYAGPKPVADFHIGIVNSAGADPGFVKYIGIELQGTLEIVEHDTASGTAWGHANAAGAESVGASAFYLTEEFRGDPALHGLLDTTVCGPACLNDFSSAGGIPVYLNRFGNRLATPELRINPGVTGPDGGNTTFFHSDSTWDDDDGDGRNSPFTTLVTPELDQPADEHPNFFGTSASAPHVAALAALMMQRARQLGLTLSPEQVYSILRDTAQPMARRYTSLVPFETIAVDEGDPGDGGYDFDTGFGFVDAEAALAAVEAMAP